MTVSPTHVSGEKEYAWNKFRSGNYVAIGWLSDYNLTGKSPEEIIALIRSDKEGYEPAEIDAFTKFLALEEGDYVAVNNTNDGLFGVGIIRSGYKYEKGKHDTGSDDKEDFYSHYREVEWKYTNYVRRRDLISPGETSWKPYGTVGNLSEEVPPYILRLLGETPQREPAKPFAAPDHLRGVVQEVERLKSDPNHQERGHESLVENFFSALGYEKHRDIKYRRGRVDVSLWHGDNILVIVEVKKDWNLSLYSDGGAVKQAYEYALEQGARYVIVTNGDYYAIFDRLKGLSSSSNQIGEFRVSALDEDAISLIQRISRDGLLRPNMEELFRNLSECFKP